MLLCAPHGEFIEAFVLLPLPENMEVAAGTELSQETEPLRRVDTSVERRKKRMVQRLQNLPLGLRSAFFTPTRQFLLIHYLRREQASVGSGGLEAGEVDGANVARAETVRELEVGEGELASGRVGSDPVNGRPARVGGRRVRLVENGRDVNKGGGGGGESGLGAGAVAAVGIGGVEAEALEVVGDIVGRGLHWREGRRRGRARLRE